MRILIADDNPVVRSGIAAMLKHENGWEICAEASNGADIVAQAAELRPDVVLLDVRMPGTSGLEAACLLRAQDPATKIILMSQHDPHQLVSRAVQVGADACLDKARIGTELVPTIKALTGLLFAAGSFERAS